MATPAERANAVKAQANELFGKGEFQAAVDKYSEAIEIDNSNAVFFTNRAFAHLKLENWGSVIQDATTAIELDAKYIKAYYRRGAARLALGKLREAKRDFKEAVLLDPANRDARAKLQDVEKAIKMDRLAKALSRDDEGDSLDPEGMEVEDSYTGPRLEGEDHVTASFVAEMLEWFKQEKKLHKKYALQLVLQARDILKREKTLQEISIPEGGHVTVFGDLHGQFYDMLNAWNILGQPSRENPCLFNGDFVDRGSFSVEVILSLFALKILYPKSVFLNRGNHETTNMNKIYGFEGEVVQKLGSNTMPLFVDTFRWLPLCSVIDNKIFVTHGGLFSRDGVTLDELRRIDRHMEPPDEGLMTEMLWSDPQKDEGRAPSKRGVGVAFGPDVTSNFLDTNGLKMVIRSHECKDEGYEVEADGKLATVFSAPNYCDQMGNKAAAVRFKQDLEPEYIQWEAVPHPSVRPMQYASMGMGGLNFFNMMR